MNNKDLNNLQEMYLNICEAVGRDEMIAANIARAKARASNSTNQTAPRQTTSSPSPTSTTAPRQTTPTPTPTSTTAPRTTTSGTQAPKRNGGGILGRVNSNLRDVAGRVGGEIGALKGRGTLGNVLGVPERIGRNRGTRQAKDLYDKTVGSLLNQEYELDNFDIILEYLVAEGYADTNQSALVIMANMSEEWKQTILEYSQMELGSLSQSINQNTRNAPIKKQQPGFQSSQSEPQRPSGVPIPGSSRVFNTAKKVGQAAVGSVLNK
jgi:hypothetical protein